VFTDRETIEECTARILKVLAEKGVVLNAEMSI